LQQIILQQPQTQFTCAVHIRKWALEQLAIVKESVILIFFTISKLIMHRKNTKQTRNRNRCTGT